MPLSKFGKKKDIVQIDADWLLGNSSIEKPLWTRTYLRIVGSLCVVGCLVWAWPAISKLWLQWEWKSQLAALESGTYEDVLPILLALHELNPDQTEPVVQQLDSADSEIRFAAYRLLQEKIDRWKKEKTDEKQLQAFVAAMQKLNCTAQETLLLRSQLASQLAAILDKSGLKIAQLQNGIDLMIAAGQPSPGSTQKSEIDPMGTPATMAPTPELRSAISVSRPPVPTTRTRIVDIENRSSAHDVDSPTLAQMGNTNASLATLPNQSNANSQLPQRSPADSISKLPPSLNEASISARPSVAEMPSRAPQKVPSIATQVVAAAPPLLKMSETTSDVSDLQTSIRGIDKLPFERLLNLLSSAQSKLVREASDELLRRGIQASHLECLLDLAQGTVERRLSLMDSMVRDQNLDSVPILTWMAEQSDPQVRRKAIALLGALSNQDAIRNLRQLKQREPDGAIADQISQVLLAAGSASNGRR